MTAFSSGKGMAALFELVPDGVRMVWIGHLDKLLEVICRLPHWMLEITFGGNDVFLIGVDHLLVIVIVVITASSDSDPLGHHFDPFLLPLALLLVSLLVALGGAPQLLPGTVCPLP
jgi:hypothetical protein